MAEKEYIEREAAKQKLAPAINDPDAIDFWEWQCSEIDDIPAADGIMMSVELRLALLAVGVLMFIGGFAVGRWSK